MTDNQQVRRARRFHSLHDGCLVLPNCWDPLSAHVSERAGAQAIATTSGGIAWAHGVPDGGGLTRSVATAALRRIAAAVDIPVTADVEGGYPDQPGGAAATVQEAIDSAAVGVNVEDSRLGLLQSTGEQVALLGQVAGAVADSGVPAFVNARIDTYLVGHGEREELLHETVQRARAYQDAGADGIFVPGLVDLDDIRELVSAVRLPVNVMAGPGSPSVRELAEAGVRRISTGTALAQSVYGTLGARVRDMLDRGSFDGIEAGIDYAVVNDAFAGASRIPG